MNLNPAVLVGVITPESLLLDAKVLQRCGALEIRYDLFPRSEWQGLVALVRAVHPEAVLIGTIRMTCDGGAFPEAEIPERNLLWKDLLENAQTFDWIDLEFQHLELLHEVRAEALRHQVQVLVSCHDFQGIPSWLELQNMVQAARQNKADGFKIAAMSQQQGDCEGLYELARKEHMGFTWFAAFAMSGTGKASRVYSLACGANLTYAALGRVVAPGQIEAGQMPELLERLPTARSEQDVWAWLRAQEEDV